MWRFLDDTLNDLEVNPWLRLRNRAVRIILSPYRLFMSILVVTGVLVWLLAGIMAFTTFTLLESLPHFEQLGMEGTKKHAINHIKSRLRDADKPDKVNWVALKQVNRESLYAIVMSEDGDFFSHQGIDYDALINAVGENIKRREWSFGASTISQQTIKNIYLTSNKTLHRKLKEIIATARLEKHLTKNEILELYLNLVEFGPDLYGIHNAARYYFNTSTDELNAAQGAFLALLMPSPRKYHFTIFKNQHMAIRHKKKYRRILQDLRFKEYISPKQYQRYLNWTFFK
jgi:monofunctional biosynthetic peptidoglycan transglycosylase